MTTTRKSRAKQTKNAKKAAPTAPSRAICLYFQVHQPWRLRRYTFFDIGHNARWFDDEANERLVKRIAARCYVPASKAILAAVRRTKGKFRCAFSISGTALDQMEAHAPEALAVFRDLAETGAVEFLAETSHHSLAALSNAAEFKAQVTAHADRVLRLFGRRPTTFRNTELVLSDGVMRLVRRLGFRAILGEGADRLLKGRSPGRIYGATAARGLKVLLRTYRFSDDIAFRFGHGTAEHRLTAERFARSLAALPPEDTFVGLFMDYETFGEHHGHEGGILDFLRDLPEAVLAKKGLKFATPSEVADGAKTADPLSIPSAISWADEARDLTAWLGNAMQTSARDALYDVLAKVRRAKRPDLLEAWRRLSTSDHLYYMCTKWSADGDVHKHFSPYATPHDAFIAFMNVLDDVERRAGDVAKGRLTATIPLVLGPRGAALAGVPSPAPPPHPRRGSRSRRSIRKRIARVPRAR